jgi:hypothetical protein
MSACWPSPGCTASRWARADDRLFVVLARPVNGLAAAARPGGQWNDSLGGDYLWSSSNPVRGSRT